MSIEQLVEAKLVQQQEKAARKKAKRKSKEKAHTLSVGSVIARDQRKLRSETRKWTNLAETANNQLVKLNELLESTKEAARFYSNVSKEILEELKDPQNWKKYSAFDYVNKMGALY